MEVAAGVSPLPPTTFKKSASFCGSVMVRSTFVSTVVTVLLPAVVLLVVVMVVVVKSGEVKLMMI